MSPQETQALQTFLNQLTQVQGIIKDPQADALIASAVAQQPDAAYLLVQRALLMEQAVNAAKAQIATLQAQLQSMQSPKPGFLDGANAWGNSAAVVARPATPIMSSPAATAQVPMQTPPQAAAPGFFSGNVGSILGTVAATAAAAEGVGVCVGVWVVGAGGGGGRCGAVGGGWGGLVCLLREGDGGGGGAL